LNLDIPPATDDPNFRAHKYFEKSLGKNIDPNIVPGAVPASRPANPNYYSVKVWKPVGTNEAGLWSIRVISPIKAGSTVAWGHNRHGRIEYPGPNHHAR